MSSNNNEGSSLKKWLNNLQQESWQLELLISGFAIFGLLELRNSIDQWEFLLEANSTGAEVTQIYSLILSIGYECTNIFILNLIVHVVVRGVWIGAIGLRSVSGDIDYEKLNYSNVFFSYYKKTTGSFDNYILKLEEFASLIFAFTFLLFFIFFSIMIFAIEIKMVDTFFRQLTGEDFKISFYWIVIRKLILFAVFLVTIDFITLGLLKRIKQKHFSRVYFFIYQFVGFITLSFLWRPLLLNFLDQGKTRKLLFFIVPYYVIFAMVQSSTDVSAYNYYPTYPDSKSKSDQRISRIIDKHFYGDKYLDTKNKTWINEDQGQNNIEYFSIPDYKITKNIFEVFIKYDFKTDRYIFNSNPTVEKISSVGYSNFISKEIFGDKVILDLKKKGERYYEKNLIAIKNAIKSSMQFSIDDQIVENENISCDFYIHPNANEKGMLCVFPIDELNNGRHHFEYKKIQQSKASVAELDTLSFTIPFIYYND